jgi:hypothetical protein
MKCSSVPSGIFLNIYYRKMVHGRLFPLPLPAQHVITVSHQTENNVFSWYVTTSVIKAEGKAPVLYLSETYAMKAYQGSGGIAPSISILCTRWRWVVSFTPRPLYPLGKKLWYQVDRRMGGPQSRSGRGGEEVSKPLPGLKSPPPPDHHWAVDDLIEDITCLVLFEWALFIVQYENLLPSLSYRRNNPCYFAGNCFNAVKCFFLGLALSFFVCWRLLCLADLVTVLKHRHTLRATCLTGWSPCLMRES